MWEEVSTYPNRQPGGQRRNRSPTGVSPAVREGCCPIFSGLSFSTTVVEAEEDLPCPVDGERLGNSKGIGGIGGSGKGGRQGRETWKEVGLERWWKFPERKEEEGHSRGGSHGYLHSGGHGGLLGPRRQTTRKGDVDEVAGSLQPCGDRRCSLHFLSEVPARCRRVL